MHSYHNTYDVILKSGEVQHIVGAQCFSGMWGYRSNASDKMAAMHYWPKYPQHAMVKKCESLIGITYPELQEWFLNKFAEFGVTFEPVNPPHEKGETAHQACLRSGFLIRNNYGVANIMLEATIIRYIDEYPNMLITWYKLLKEFPELNKSPAKSYAAFSISNRAVNPLFKMYPDLTVLNEGHENSNHSLFAYAMYGVICLLPAFQKAISSTMPSISGAYIHPALQVGAHIPNGMDMVNYWNFPANDRPTAQQQIDWILKNVE